MSTIDALLINKKMDKDDGQPTLRLFLNEKLERQYLAFEGAVGKGRVQMQKLAFCPKH